MSSRINGRHRAAVRAKTPLSTIAEAVTATAGAAGRRTAVIAASSGLVVSMGVTAADAAPLPGEPEPVSAIGAAKAAALLPVSTTALEAPADATVTLATATVASATPKPKPKPKPVPRPVVREAASVSRSAERAPTGTGDLSATRANVLSVAARYVGTPYRYGGTTPSGFDCSGFTQYVFNQVGVSLPRTSSSQAVAGTRVSRSAALPGDLVWKPGHIGIYAGGNMMYDSPRTGKDVSLREIFSSEFVFIRVL